jgi:hypothetical protein
MPTARLISLLGVVCVAAAVFVAAAPASASTVLCKKAGASCEAAQQYPGGTTINASLSGGNKAKFTSGFATLQCTGSTLAATTEAEAGAPIAAELTALTFSGCTAPGFTGCSAVSSNLPTNSTLAATGAGNGTLTVQGGGFDFTCTIEGSPITCRYSASSAPFSLTGGSPAALAASGVVFEKVSGSSGLCSKTMTSSATYSVSSPTPLYSSTGTGTEKVTSLCKEKVTFCSPTSKYSVGQTLEASASSFNFYLFGGNWECNSSLKGQIEAGGGESANANIEGLAFTECGGSGGWTCEKGSIATKGSKFTSSGNGNGTLKFGLAATFNCAYLGAKATCKYGNASVSLPVVGGVGAQIIATGVPMGRESGSSPSCSPTMTWSASYAFTQPSSLYLTS